MWPKLSTECPRSSRLTRHHHHYHIRRSIRMSVPATRPGDFLPRQILLKTIDFERPGGREWLPSGTPFQKFYTFFGRFFGRACLRPRYVKSLRSGFFCNVKKVCSKGHIGYAAWGLPQGPAFACTLTMSNKTKKQKLKKTQVLFRILI